MDIIQETANLITEASAAPPPIDTTQPLWVQQERRIMYDIMAIMTTLSTMMTLGFLIYDQYRNGKV